jgi:hypothetical protein
MLDASPLIIKYFFTDELVAECFVPQGRYMMPWRKHLTLPT